MRTRGTRSAVVNAARLAVTAVLTGALAFGGVPTYAIAEAIDEDPAELTSTVIEVVDVEPAAAASAASVQSVL